MLRTILKSIDKVAAKKLLPAWTPDSLRRLAQGATRMLQYRYHVHSMKKAIGGQAANLEDIAAFLRGHAIPVRAPLVLISQVQRSGGSLLSQLFDGHPALAAYPTELRFGFSQNDQWPLVDPRQDHDQNYELLVDLKLCRFMQHGYIKGGRKLFSPEQRKMVERQVERLRFFLVPRIQYLVFKQLFESAPPKSSRDIFDHFFTANFNAWLDYQGRLDEKKWITAFAPRLAHDDVRTAAFFDSYPDGRLIQIIRDPRTWYPSAKNHRKSVLDGKKSGDLLAMWVESAESMLRNKARYGDRAIILTFENLVGNTERTMRGLARELDIDYHPILLQPTFNGAAIQANSSFGIGQFGVIKSPLARASKLSEAERRIIEGNCLSLYDSLAAKELTARADAEGSMKAHRFTKQV
ncbi:MAG: sulfotransferase [Candidatus Binatia bacterium]